MRVRTKLVSLAAAASAAAAGLGLFAWLATLEGTAGLLAWTEWKYIVGAFLGLCVLPLAIAAAGLKRLRDEAWRPGAILASVSMALSAAALAASLAGLAAILSLSTRMPAPAPALALVDPKAGIAPAPGRDGHVLLSLSSDPHWGAASADAAARSAALRSVAAATPRPDAFFILGDNVEMGFLEGPWRQEALELAATLGGMPVRPILGNHDAILNGQRHFRDFFLPAAATDSGSPFYYSMDAGAARIVVLDLLWGAEEFGARQAAWLEKTLAATPPGRQVIVLSHCFFWSSGYVDEGTGMPWYDHFGTIAKVAPVLERHRVALVVSGHNHYMELLERGGVTYAVAGVLGGKPDPVPSHVSPASAWLRRGEYGRLDLDISAAGIGLAFRDRDGALLHEARIPSGR